MRPSLAEVLKANAAIMGELCRSGMGSDFDLGRLETLRVLTHLAAQDAAVGQKVLASETAAIQTLLEQLAPAYTHDLSERVAALSRQPMDDLQRHNAALRTLLDEVHVHLETSGDTERCARVRQLYKRITKLRCCYVLNMP